MEKSGKKLAPPKLAHNLKKMGRARKGCRRIAVEFNKEMKKEGKNLRVGKSTAYRVMEAMGLYKEKPTQKTKHLKRPEEPFTSFAMDFKEKVLAMGTRIHVLDIIDEFNNAVAVLDAHQSANGQSVIASLEPFARIFAHNRTVKIRVDNGKEFDNEDVILFCLGYGIILDFVEKGCPWENAFVERNIRTVTEECLNLFWINDIQHAQKMLTEYKHEFNRRENMGLDYCTPLEHLGKFYAVGRSSM